MSNDGNLGKLIKEARTQAGLLQKDIVVGLDLGDFQTISKWENGRGVPSANNLIRLARLLGVSYSEQNYWMGLAGYTPPTDMPTEAQIKEELKIYVDIIAQEFLAAGIIDYRFTVWALNLPGISIFGLEKTQKLLRGYGNEFEWVFDPLMDSLTTSVDSFQKQIIAWFKLFNLHRRHEPFFKKYPSCLKNNLGNQYEAFEQLWHETPIDDPQYLVNLSRQPIPSIYFIEGERHIVNLTLDFQPTYHFPQFGIMRFVPSEIPKSLLFTPQAGMPQVITLWDEVDVQPLINQYLRDNDFSVP
jgi:transcriptional regulator with XRE-family HTH domain